MLEDKLHMFRNRLDKVFRHREKIARRTNVSCYRVYDHDLPEFPLSIDKYESAVHIAEYKRRHGLSDEEHTSWLTQTLAIISDVLKVDLDQIYTKLRQVKPGRGGQYQKLEASERGKIVHEDGLQFIINLTDYLDTGLFLDHRVTRHLIRNSSLGKRVLNLFAYTGSFSVYAAAGGALEVVTIDLSNTYLQWARKNLVLNGFVDEEKFTTIQADVKTFLTSPGPAKFDIIIMDPPTFSNSKRMNDFLDIQRDHVDLINQCMQLLNEDGKLYFSTNSRKFILEKDKINASSVKDITKTTTPFDFKGKLFRWCYLISK